MNKEKKVKIEAIYPLNTMQNALLFHHLTEKDDRGFLNVECIIEGSLDIDLLKKSWDLAIERHPVLRTSVHWENIKNPIQVIIPISKVNFNILDWTNFTTTEHKKKLNELKVINKKNSIDFQKNPLSKISLIKVKPNYYYFVWSCHHLLLDGWSSSIILKDVFEFYDSLITGKKLELESIPSYKSYLNWQKKIDTNAAKEFWRNTFKDYKQPFLFNKNQHKTKKLVQNNIKLSEETSIKVQEIAKAYRITLNTLFQALWALIISKYLNHYDITYGNTVSGRSGDFPNIENITGMFSNVIPVRIKIDFNLSVKDWLKNIQSQQIEARKFEHITINEITEWIETSSNRIFDSLFIFENFPWDDIRAGNIKIHSSKSGITTIYPLTLTIKPSVPIDINLISDESIFSLEANHWILNRFEEIINILGSKKDISIETLYENITSINFKIRTQASEIINKTNVIAKPKNKTEFELLKIWKSILKNNNIGLTDNFFEIGGNSILSLQIISKARELGIAISPNELFENQTIRELADFIENRETKTTKINNFNHLVDVKSLGKLAPLFCIHGGGSHFFYYNALSTYINPDRPLYALQASEVEDNIILHESIIHMANDFVKEIKAVSPKGPYHIMGYC
ncbi:condensation domain-containing protein, partial [uncultured Algibacter sp.]|uniref:condensation domain-containing protein n=1 Tax=uncultured Algibacter sp. TaxID=298659 RepID=UPI002617AAAE